MAPPKRQSPTVRHRRLSAELKRLRESAGVTIQAAADQIGSYRTKIHRMERGEWRQIREADLRALATLYGAGAQKADALVEIAKQASHRGWWARYPDVLGAGAYTSLESGAQAIKFYSGMLVPGLLQIREYATAVVAAGGVTDDQEALRRVEARMRRQEAVRQKSQTSIEAVIDEAALRRMVGGPAVMRKQVRSLRDMAVGEDSLSLRLLPFSHGAHAGLGGQFVILEFPGDHESPIVFIDESHTGLFLEEEESDSYVNIYKMLVESSLDLRETLTRLESLDEEMSQAEEEQ